MNEPKEERVLSNGEMREEVLKEAFRSVGYFFWPLYFDPEAVEYIISLKTLANQNFYQERKHFLSARGILLLEALKKNPNLKRCDNCKDIPDFIFNDASRANTASALIVRMFINNRNSRRLRDLIEDIWECKQQDDSFLKHKHEEV